MNLPYLIRLLRKDPYDHYCVLHRYLVLLMILVPIARRSYGHHHLNLKALTGREAIA